MYEREVVATAMKVVWMVAVVVAIVYPCDRVQEQGEMVWQWFPYGSERRPHHNELVWTEHWTRWMPTIPRKRSSEISTVDDVIALSSRR